MFCYCTETRILNCPGLSRFPLRRCSPQHQSDVTCRGGCTMPLSHSSSRTHLPPRGMQKPEKDPDITKKDQGKNLKTAIKQKGLNQREGQNKTKCFVFHKKQPNSLPLSTGWAAARPDRCVGGHRAALWSLHEEWRRVWLLPAPMHCLSHSCRKTLAPSSTYPY